MRKGAKEKYAISQATIIDAYNKAFQYLTVNHGTQARKDIEVMRGEMMKMSQLVVKMSEETVKLREENKALTQKLEQYETKNDKRLTNIELEQKSTRRELSDQRKLLELRKVKIH